MNQYYQTRIDKANKPKTHMIRDGKGGFRFVTEGADGAADTVGEWNEGPDGVGSPGAGLTIWNDPADGSAYIIDKESRTGQKVDFGPTAPGTKPGPRATTEVDPNTKERYNMIMGTDGQWQRGSKVSTPGTTTDTTTESTGMDALGQPAITSEKTVTTGATGTKTDIFNTAPIKTERKFDGQGRELRTVEKTIGADTDLDTKYTGGSAPDSKADERADARLEMEKARHGERGQEKAMTTQQKATRFNQLIKSIPAQADAQQEKGYVWNGPEPDPIASAQYAVQLDQIIELGEELGIDVRMYESIRDEFQGLDPVQQSMQQFEDILNTIDED